MSTDVSGKKRKKDYTTNVYLVLFIPSKHWKMSDSCCIKIMSFLLKTNSYLPLSLLLFKCYFLGKCSKTLRCSLKETTTTSKWKWRLWVVLMNFKTVGVFQFCTHLQNFGQNLCLPSIQGIFYATPLSSSSCSLQTLHHTPHFPIPQAESWIPSLQA